MKIAETEDFDIRYTHVDDMEHLRAWFKTEGTLHWYPPGDDSELENFIRVWNGFTRFSASLTATCKNKPVGIGVLFLMPYRKVAHQAMFQIIVDPEKRREGIGRALVRNLMHQAKTHFNLELLNVEILDDSVIIPLLKELGFEEFARQERYVKEGDKYFHRILMETEL